MERGSSKHSPRVDDLAFEVRGTEQGVAGSRAEEWHMAEPAGEDQPQPTSMPLADEANGLSRLGRYIGLSALPGDRRALRQSAETLLAPDDILDDLDRLPADATYATVKEIWDALHPGEARSR
jgi:hypothetical protein